MKRKSKKPKCIWCAVKLELLPFSAVADDTYFSSMKCPKCGLNYSFESTYSSHKIVASIPYPKQDVEERLNK
jgi:hypothetical protein